MIYSLSEGGEEEFLYDSDNPKSEELLLSHEMRREPLADLVASLVRIKAIRDYVSREGAIKHLQPRARYKEELKTCIELYLDYFEPMEMTARFPFQSVPQRSIIEAYLGNNKSFIDNVCLSLFSEEKVKVGGSLDFSLRQT
ncbi:hypothetical protein HYT53_04790 [Candidatus Woesearchaeota archaeon]|nr:hypothetical protein [Candidatus Woesearchaeota archaeon]